MAYVTVPKDLTRVKSKIVFGLTKRQLICFGGALLVGVPLYFLLRGRVTGSAAALIMVFAMLPGFLLALYERHGQPLEVVVWQIVQCCFIQPKERPYQTDNAYFDMLSILAQARSYDPKDYKVGQKILFPMATGRRVEEQTLIYRGKEEVKANNDTVYRCLVFSFVEYKKGKEKEVITFFVSDDKNHLPIRLDMYLNFGSAKAFFKSVRGNRYPMTSVVRKK